MFRFILIICCIATASHGVSQNEQTIYQDSLWKRTTKEAAYYYTKIEKIDTVYKTTSYFMKDGKIHDRSFYKDTAFTQPRGWSVVYFPNGNIEDSIFYDGNGSMSRSYKFYASGKKRVDYTVIGGQEMTKGYDENGREIPGFVYMREAEFRGGSAAFINYLKKNLNYKVPKENNAPIGTYTVVVLFAVGKDGRVGRIKAETKHGYGMEQEAMRVLIESPAWNPAIYCNEPVVAYRRLPITFQMTR